PLGICHGIMARMMGAGNVIVVGAPEYRLKLARKLCADHTVDINQFNAPAKRIEAVKSMTDNRGADLVAECAGVPEAVSQGLDMLRLGGTLLVAGNYIDMGAAPINPQKQILSKNARIIGVNGQTAASYATALKLINRFSQTILIGQMVTHKFKIEEAERALQTAISMESLEVAIVP
ncbi:MAG TPA: zinc-binding dehydrogenase, partial [Terriglobales bacterium]|nr:zinc-binding dehydrogenase [Terriglobales bacterium]